MTAGIGARARYIWLTDICKCHLPNMLFTHATLYHHAPTSVLYCGTPRRLNPV